MSEKISKSKRKPFKKAQSLTAASGVDDSITVPKTTTKRSAKLDITPSGKSINYQNWEEYQYKRVVGLYGAAIAAIIKTSTAPVIQVEPVPNGKKVSKTLISLREQELKSAVQESKENRLKMEKLFAELISEESMTERSLDAVKRIVMPKEGYIVKHKPIIIIGEEDEAEDEAEDDQEENGDGDNEGNDQDDNDYASMPEGSTDSESSMIDDWPDVLQRCDVVRLIKRIKAAHLMGSSSINPKANLLMARKDFELMAQKNNETLLSYKERYELAIKNLKDMGTTVPYNNTELGLKFFMSLSDDLNQFKQYSLLTIMILGSEL